MTGSHSIEVKAATAVTEELVSALRRLIPQLSESAPPDRQSLAEIVASPGNTVLLAYDGGKIAGTLTLVVFRTPTAMRALIEDVVVDSAARGRGIGEALVRKALHIAAARGARNVDLTSRPVRAAANRLYERAGFVRRETNVYRYLLHQEDA